MSTTTTSTTSSTSSSGSAFYDSLILGGSIFLGDMILSPRRGVGDGNMTNVLFFLVEGVFVYWVYEYMVKKETTYKTTDKAQSMLGGGLTVALVIFVTDMFIRPDRFFGAGMEFMKFFLQGFIVNYILKANTLALNTVV